MVMENRHGWSVDCDRIRVCSQTLAAAAQEVLLDK